MKDIDLSNLISGLSDDDWRNLLLSSLKTQQIGQILMPGFPDTSIQERFTGLVNEDMINEAFVFYSIVRDACNKYGEPLKKDSVILDFGSAWGRISRMFLKDISSYNIYGVDIIPEMVKICKDIMPYGNFSVVKNGLKLKFSENTFNCIVAYSVFSHLSEENQLFWSNELYRIMAPRGILVFTTLKHAFINQCLDAYRNPNKTKFERGLVYVLEETFSDPEASLLDYDPNEYFYLPSGGGDFLPPDEYGWAIMPKEYLLKHWKNFHLLEYMGDSTRCPQAVVIMQKIV
jgi:ubiquinone/menaquinone biosynthesis C-methylase UbiE